MNPDSLDRASAGRTCPLASQYARCHPIYLHNNRLLALVSMYQARRTWTITVVRVGLPQLLKKVEPLIEGEEMNDRAFHTLDK